MSRFGIDPADYPSDAELAEMEKAWRARDDDTDTDTDFAPAAPPAPTGGPPREGSGGTLSTREEE